MLTELFPLQLAQAAPVSLSPIWILLAGVAFVITAIAFLRIHPFLSLMLAGVLIGTLSHLSNGSQGIAIIEATKQTMAQFGGTAAGIAWIIALAAVIGYCLMESGAADQIVRKFLHLFGEKRAGITMLVSSFVLSIPVFFDTVFYLLVPLAQALAFRMGKRYVYLITAVCLGATITHSLVPPTPGPLIVVEKLGINLGFTILGGLALGILPAIASLFLGEWFERKMKIPLRTGGMIKIEDLEAISAKSEDELPPFWISLMPVILPVLLIALSSIVQEFFHSDQPGILYSSITVLGYKHIAMFIGMLIAVSLLAKYKHLGKTELWKALESPMGMAGTIILITSAGGAFGGMIRASGIGDTITALTDGSGFSFVLLAWFITAVMKVAQGSSTTAMITASGIMAGILAALEAAGTPLGYDPFYIFAAIAFGAMFCSWMNDSGFWIVCKMTGFTESETLRSWTVAVSVISLIGLAEILVFHLLIPHPFG